jgi:DNA-binding PadR family transcriptional regulator
MKDEERDLLRKCILELLVKGHVHYTDICKKAVATCHPFITPNTVPNQFYGYLLKNGYVERVSPGVYRITEKGRMLLAALGPST